MKKRIAILLASAMLLTSALTGLASCKSGGNNANVDASKGHVYYLQFKPEQDQQWQDLAKLYTEKTGVQVDVLTAAEGTYETTLASEIAKTDAPTLFQVNGPVGLANWKDYCADLSDAAITKELTSQDFALKDSEGKVRGVAYVIETYGIITNKALIEKAGHSMDEIKDFESLKAVADDIHARAAELGFDAFTSAGMDSSSDWRFKTHLANLPIYYEYKADNIGTTEAIKGSFLDGYRKIWDLYITDSATEPALLSSKTGSDAEQEFVDGQAVFFQNGTWEYDAVKAIGDENLAWTPIYIDADGEENQGVCTGTENYLCVNGNAADEDVKATLDFLEWVVTSEEGTDALANKMNFVSPFKKAKEASNTLVKLANEMVAAGKTPVSWNFPTMPSEQWKNDVGSALTAYAANPSDDTWEAVRVAFVDGWAKEYAANK
jgi:raffinose/stachyose/melibiose transport system substrate-binding protein